MASPSRARVSCIVAPAPASARSPFLDAVRAIAIVRVVLMHTYGARVLSFFVAAMPAMFFCGGALAAASLERAGSSAFIGRRLRRLLVPLWAFGAVALSVMCVAALWHPGTQDYALRGRHLLGWVFPVARPRGPAAGSAWWAALWYVRAYLHLLLLSPLLRWAFRRLPVACLAVPLAGVVLVQALMASGHSVAPYLTDMALFGVFWFLGFAYRDGVFSAMAVRRRWEAAFAFALGAAVWILGAGAATALPLGVVNSSPATHLLVGLAWLCAFLALEAPLGRLAAGRVLSPLVNFVNARALTVYLWHVPVIWVAASAPVKGMTAWSGVEPLARLLVVLAGCAAAVLAFGWVEDAGAGRPRRLWPFVRRGGPAAVGIPSLEAVA